MAELQYIDMILNGFFTDERLFKSYLIRKQKEVKRENFVTESEFIKRCCNVILLFENDIENQYLERKEESEFIEKPSRENFYIQLSSFTDEKFKGELWHSQIQFIKKCIDEIKNHNTTIEIAIKDIDIDNYLNFIFLHKSISRESKKNAILKLMEDAKSEKTISNYRIWIDYVFNQQNYWIEPTEEERKLFDELRVKSSEQEKSLFESYSKGSPKPRVDLIKEFEAVIINRLSKEPLQKTTSDFMEGLLPKDLNILAAVIGKLDFIKSFQLTKAEKYPEKWYALLYWFELKVTGQQPPMGVEGTFIKSKIIPIGIKKCNSTGLSFYNSFINIDITNKKLLIRDFGDNWKEVAIKLSNNNIEVIKYLENNY